MRKIAFELPRYGMGVERQVAHTKPAPLFAGLVLSNPETNRLLSMLQKDSRRKSGY